MKKNEYDEIPKGFLVNDEMQKEEDALSLLDDEGEVEDGKGGAEKGAKPVSSDLASKKLNKSLKLLPILILYMLLIQNKDKDL